MIDFAAVLRRTIDALPRNTPQIRERVYAKARQTVQAKLDMINPPPSAALVQRQLAALEDAIRQIEADFTVAVEEPAPAEEDPFAGVFDTAEPAQQTQPEPVRTAQPQSWAEPPLEPVAPPPVMPRAPEFRLPELRQAELRQPAPPPPGKPAATSAPAPVSAPAPTFGPEHDAGTLGLDEPVLRDMPRRARPPRQNKSGAVVISLLAIALLGGGTYVAWTKRDAISGWLGGSGTSVATAPEAPAPTTPEPATPATPATPEPGLAPAEPVPAPATPADEAAPQKFTQRLNPDGTETDPGAGGQTAAGEASFAPFVPGETPAAPAAPQTDTAAAGDAAEPAAAPDATPDAAPIAIGQKAIFYEERTTGSEGSALAGAVVWSLVRESPGGDRPPEPAVRGDLSIPENGLEMRITLRRNADATLPASHIMELVVSVPDTFAGGNVDEVQRVNFKPTEENAGASLVAIPVRVADGFFLVALDSSAGAQQRNLQLMGEQNWIDIPVVYRTGRRALFTMEKGLTGQQVFKQVLDAWAAAPLQN